MSLNLVGRWQRLRSVPGLFRSVAITTGMIAVGIGFFTYVVINLPGKSGIIRVGPWQGPTDYLADFAEAPGTAPGTSQEVRIAGVAVGDITGAEVTEEGRARLTLTLKPKYAKVYDNARATLKPKTLLMDMYVLLDPGGPPGKLLEPGSVIPLSQTMRPVPVDEVLSHLDERARHALGGLLEEAAVALAEAGSLPAALQAGAGTLEAARPLLEALETRRARIARLVTGLADIATAAGADDARLTRLLTDARASLDTIAARDAELDATLARLPGFTGELRAASGQLQALTGELDPALAGLRAAGDRLPGALAGLRGVVEQLDGTLDRAAPVVSAARPLVGDLRPLVASARVALGDLAAVTPRLDPLTANLVEYLPFVAPVVYELNSAMSYEDAQGNWARAFAVEGSDAFTGFSPEPSDADRPSSGRRHPGARGPEARP